MLNFYSFYCFTKNLAFHLPLPSPLRHTAGMFGTLTEINYSPQRTNKELMDTEEPMKLWIRHHFFVLIYYF